MSIKKLFAKDFELSNLDAFLLGPKVLTLFLIKKSLNPAKYSSGPITANSIFFSLQNLSIDFLSAGLISSQDAILDIPAFPGIQNNLFVFSDLLKDQQIECSLAPLPITKIFNFFSFFCYRIITSMNKLSNISEYTVSQLNKSIKILLKVILIQ